MLSQIRRYLSRELIVLLAVAVAPTAVHAFSSALACLPPTDGLTVTGDINVVEELPGGG